MRANVSSIKLNTYDDLFEADNLPVLRKVSNEQTQVVDVPLAKLHEFKNHPFRVLLNAKMDEMVQSIKERGVLVPGIVRPLPDGEYEIIAGHTRRKASELAGKDTMPVFIKNMSDDDAVVVMVDTNIQREDILPSEKARAYRMKYDALKHQGKKGIGSSLEKVGELAGDSAKTVQRYIQLSRLTDALLKMVDCKRLGFIQGVDIALLSTEQQLLVQEVLEETEVNVSKEQASKIKEYGQKDELTKAVIELILNDKKTKERKIVIKAKTIKDYFADDVPEDEIQNIIIGLLDEWKNRQ